MNATTNREFLFETPNSPEEFGVVLAPPDLRSLDFSALDYQTMLRASVEYIRTYQPDKFNDFVVSNGYITLIEILCYLSSVLSERSDILADESFLPTSQTKEAVLNHLALIGQHILRATSAVVDIEISFDTPVAVEVKIPAGMRFSFTGPDGKAVFYEIFRAPGDFTSAISVPAGKRGVIAYGIEGIFGNPLVVNSPGGPDQFIDIPFSNVLDEPIVVTIKTGTSSSIWQRVPIIEKANPNDEVFEVLFLDAVARIRFGNDIAGKSPISGSEITVQYRIGGGIRGRIAAGIINESRPVTPLPPLSATISATISNPVPSQGGTDEESIDAAKARAPREFATHNSIVTGEDYSVLAKGYSHPVYGTVAKAVGTIRTGIEQRVEALAEQVRNAATLDDAVKIMQDQFINRNIVELYILAEGPGGVPVTPNNGLKRGLATYISDLNVLTDEIRVLDGQIKFVDVQATIIMSKNADPGTVKVQVQEVISNFFSIANFQFGSPLYLSNLYQSIQGVPGIKYVNIFQPDGDIIPVDKSHDSSGKSEVAFNELIFLGNVDIKFYFESTGFRIPPVGTNGAVL